MTAEMNDGWMEALDLAGELFQGPQVGDQKTPVRGFPAEGAPEPVHLLFEVEGRGIDRRGRDCDHGERLAGSAQA